MELLPFSHLNGQEIVRWTGTEMALSGGDIILWTGPDGTTQEEITPVEWAHPSIPYLQLIGIHIHLANGTALHLISQLEDGTSYHGLYLIQQPAPPPDTDGGEPETGSIYHERNLQELPLGIASVTSLRHDGPAAVIEANIAIGNDMIHLLCGEVYACNDGSYRIVENDESILLQLNGTRPAIG